MRIAQVAPLIESIPPRLYGGSERVVSYLTEELVNQGHDVTLFASGDSITAANLVPCCTQALRLDPDVSEPRPGSQLLWIYPSSRRENFELLRTCRNRLGSVCHHRSPCFTESSIGF